MKITDIQFEVSEMHCRFRVPSARAPLSHWHHIMPRDTPVGLWHLDGRDARSWVLGSQILQEYTLPSVFS
jgi:hypothetical protein